MQNSGSVNHPFFMIMQGDNNLVIYDSAWAYFWYSATNRVTSCYLQMKNNGNLIMYQSDGVIAWQTNTILSK
jgi:hypothetical protein